MKEKFTLLLLLIINYTSIGQTEKFGDIIEIKADKTHTFFLNKSFKIIKKDCSDFRLECKFNSEAFVFEDSLKIFYKNKKLYTKGKFLNGLKTGEFIWYYTNGKIATQGQYKDDIKDGVWKNYYENGALHKVIEYKNDTVLLLQLYDKKGKTIIKDGNGHFSDYVYGFAVMGAKNKMEGNIVDGIMDGDWLIYLNDKLVGKENFQNKRFLNGISYSDIGTQSYTDQFYATFIDFIPSEFISFKSISTNCDLPGRIVAEKNNLNDILKKNYTPIGRSLPQNYWFFAGLLFDGNDLKNVTIFSLKDDIDKVKLAEFVKNSYLASNKVNENRDSRLLIPLVIKDGQLYLSNDPEIALLNY